MRRIEEKVSVDRAAELLLLHRRQFTKLVQRGVIPKRERGSYELKEVVNAYVNYLRDQRDGRDTNHRERYEKARADREEMEVAAAKGDLIPYELVEKHWVDAVMRFRSKILSLPNKAAPIVAQESDTEVVRNMMEEWLNEALEELSGSGVPNRAAVRRHRQRSEAATEAESE